MDASLQSEAFFISYESKVLLNATDTWAIEDFKHRQQLQTASPVKFIRLQLGGTFVIKSQFGRRDHRVVFGGRLYS